jgi:hypothetical protein
MSREAVSNVSAVLSSDLDDQAHEAAIARMAYLFAAIEDTDAFVARVRALQPAAG